MKVEYKCPKCDTAGHSELYRIGEGKDDGLYTCSTCWREWAKDYKRGKGESDMSRAYMQRFYEDMIRWNLASGKPEDAEELAHYVGHELADTELTEEELESELKASYHELEELHAESNIAINEWVQWVKDGIEQYKSWMEE